MTASESDWVLYGEKGMSAVRMAQSEPRDQPNPEPEPYLELSPARCPECRVILRRVSLDEMRCPEHGIVRPWYGKP